MYDIKAQVIRSQHKAFHTITVMVWRQSALYLMLQYSDTAVVQFYRYSTKAAKYYNHCIKTLDGLVTFMDRTL